MKKLIALITVLAFAVALAGAVYADARTPDEKLAAGRAYLKLLDKKIIAQRKLGASDVVAKLQAEKKSTMARMQAWKAGAEAGVPVPVAPMPPAPPRPVVARPAPIGAGLFGLGINTVASGSYVATGKGSVGGAIGVRGDVVLADPLALGTLVGLSEKDVTYRIGLGYVTGGGSNLTAIPLYLDGALALPADMLGGINSYVSGGVNYSLYGNGKTTGRTGYEIAYGIKGDLGLGLGNTAIELGYGAIRSKTVSTGSKFTVAVAQDLAL